jgi:hypothetical protein
MDRAHFLSFQLREKRFYFQTEFFFCSQEFMMKLALTFISCFVSCYALASNYETEESLFALLGNDAAAYDKDPALYE